MMDVNEAIKELEKMKQSAIAAIDISSKMGAREALMFNLGRKELAEVCIYALRAQQAAEKNDPLTLDELREMDGQPVWIDDWIEPYNGWELSEDASDYFEGRDVKKYGSAWVAYRRPPKEDAK